MSTALQTTAEEKPMSFVPYGSSDAIKLSVSIIQNMIAVPTKSGHTCSKRDALRFMMMCQARRLNPFEGDAFLVGYDSKDGPQFSLITAHQAFLKRAEIHPEFDGMRSGIIVLKDEDTGATEDIEGDFHLPGQKVVGGWASVHFKNRKYPISRRIRMERFNKGFAQWQVDPAGMIVKCAEADALRSSFPTMLGGLYMQDEVSLDVKATAVEVSKLVEVRTTTPAPANGRQIAPAAADDGDLAPAEASEARAPEDKPLINTEQQQLQAIVEAAGHDFATFVKCMAETGSLKDADSLTSWDEISKADAVRLIRVLQSAKTRPVMLQQLEAAKGGAK